MRQTTSDAKSIDQYIPRKRDTQKMIDGLVLLNLKESQAFSCSWHVLKFWPEYDSWSYKITE